MCIYINIYIMYVYIPIHTCIYTCIYICTEYCHMITDARRPRPEVHTQTPHRVLPYDNWRMETQAKGACVDAILRTAIWLPTQEEAGQK